MMQRVKSHCYTNPIGNAHALKMLCVFLVAGLTSSCAGIEREEHPGFINTLGRNFKADKAWCTEVALANSSSYDTGIGIFEGCMEERGHVVATTGNLSRVNNQRVMDQNCGSAFTESEKRLKLVMAAHKHCGGGSGIIITEACAMTKERFKEWQPYAKPVAACLRRGYSEPASLAEVFDEFVDTFRLPGS